MVAVPEIEASGPAAVAGMRSPFVRARHRRLVAIAETSMELLRPESDLADLCRGADHVDLLVACDDTVPDEDDLVAALSELVGFDPEQGVYCLAPAPSPTDPARTAVDRAARRIALVYGIPLLRYRCLELSVVPSDG
jgi:hypothetical protein